MITCSVCGQENDDLSIICSSCKSYVQGRVDALNLFETVWGIIEAPGATFKRIVLARHKNYTFILSALFGICLVFELAWYKSVAEHVSSLLTIVAAAAIVGPVLGIAVVWVLSVVLLRASRLLKGNGTRRNLYAVIAYASMPMVLVLVFIVPLQTAVFGIDFFGTNPPPMIIRPIEYTVLLCIKGLAALWTFALIVKGTIAANAFDKSKVVPVAAFVVLALAAIGYALHFMRV
jgi:hypothetical protein